MSAAATPLRVGIGYDVHAFAAVEDGRRLVLGGVDISYPRGLLGHSDADVLTHAVADALLGAARAGDIGQHFPDSDPRFAGADSLLLLAKVGELIRSLGWQVLDLDCVVVAQEPKLSSYRDSMRANLARTLRITVDAVGLKATTTEGLGFEGRGEGVAAQAVALLTRIPDTTTPAPDTTPAPRIATTPDTPAPDAIVTPDVTSPRTSSTYKTKRCCG